MHSDSSTAFARLQSIVARLLAPDGCAWDREQTPRTMRANLIEEAYECVAAIDADDDPNLQEELGDLLFLSVMISRMKEQEGAFSIESAIECACEKLVRRHPHVFGEAEAPPRMASDEIIGQWERIKAAEKKRDSVLDGIPKSFPPLERAHDLQSKAARVGFDWPDTEPIWGKLAEESEEVRRAQAASDATGLEHEIGDLLFTVINLSRALGVDPSLALASSNSKFERRFREIERRLKGRGIALATAGLAAMDEIWNQLKAEEAAGESSK